MSTPWPNRIFVVCESSTHPTKSSFVTSFQLSFSAAGHRWRESAGHSAKSEALRREASRSRPQPPVEPGRRREFIRVPPDKPKAAQILGADDKPMDDEVGAEGGRGRYRFRCEL